MRLAKGRTITLLPCIVLFALLTGVMNGEKVKEDIGDRIAVLYPDDAELSVRILAKYVDLKHILPYYSLLAEKEQFESAKERLESAQDAASYAKRDLDESLRGRPVVTATVMEPEKEAPPELRDEPDVPDESDVPDPVTVKRPPAFPERVPPRQITIYPYRLEEAAPKIAKHFPREELIKHWPK